MSKALEDTMDELLNEQKTFIGRFGKELRDLRKQCDLIDLRTQDGRPGGFVGGKSLADELKENENVARLFHNKIGSATFTIEGKHAEDIITRKTLITSDTVGFSTTGVMPEERDGLIVPEARRALRMRNVIASRPTSLGKIVFPKVNVGMTKASPVAEGAEKPETGQTYTMVSEDVKTIALVIPASRQVLEDWAELDAFLRGSLSYEIAKEEDRQILYGDGTGENLNGLTGQAQAFDISLLTASLGYNFIDTISAAMQQIGEDDEPEPTFIALHTRDLFKIRRLKDSQNKYLLGDPNSPFPPALWGLPIVGTNALSVGKFLVGRGSADATELRDRMQIEVAISTEHSDYFVKNKVMIRAEKRCALVTKRPNCFVYGDLASSPA